MKKETLKKIKKMTCVEVDLEWLKHCKKMSTKAKLNWLESAFKFGKMRKF